MPEKNSKTQFYFTIIVISGWKPQLLHGTLHNQIDSNQINIEMVSTRRTLEWVTVTGSEKFWYLSMIIRRDYHF